MGPFHPVEVLCKSPGIESNLPGATRWVINGETGISPPSADCVVITFLSFPRRRESINVNES